MPDQHEAQPREIVAEPSSAETASPASTEAPSSEAVPEPLAAAVAKPAEAGGPEASLAAAKPAENPAEVMLEAADAGPARRPSWLPVVVPISARAAANEGTPILDEWPAAGETPPSSGRRKIQWKRWLTGRAASIALAAAIGALIGSAIPAGLARMTASNADAAAPDPVDALRQSIGQLSAEIKALQAAVGEAGQASAGGIAALEERLDGTEQSQSELAAKIASLADGLARQPVTANGAGVSTETTGSVTPAKPTVAEDWVLWRVQNGRALVQGNGGYFEVAPGSTLPGLGLVQRIMRRDGRWVVVTRNGLIVSRG